MMPPRRWGWGPAGTAEPPGGAEIPLQAWQRLHGQPLPAPSCQCSENIWSCCLSCAHPPVPSAPPRKETEKWPTSGVGTWCDKCCGQDWSETMEILLPRWQRPSLSWLSLSCLNSGRPLTSHLSPAGPELFLFPSLSSYEDRFILGLKHKAALSGGGGTVTNRCISNRVSTRHSPSPGSDKCNSLPSLLLPSKLGYPARHHPMLAMGLCWG